MSDHPKITSVSVRMTDPSEVTSIAAYDNTKLTAGNTCPTWGIVRYAMHKTFTTTARAMPLEAGSAMHEVFAAVRLWQLMKYDAPEALKLHEFHGIRLFGETKYRGMLAEINEDEDERTNKLNFCLQALYQSGFYDDPYDKRRTMSNLEEAAIVYIDRWDFTRHPLWIRDIEDPFSDVGIEIAFDCVITFTFDDGTTRSFRFCGKLDGLHWRDKLLVVGENKTASRLDEAWSASFDMSSQVTGYMLAATAFTGVAIHKAIIWGVQIPLPKSGDLGGLTKEYPTRETHHFARWFNWFYHTVTEVYERYEGNPIDAPKYTHSCNRFFRPCSLIPFCTEDDEGQRQILGEMVTQEWSPLHDDTQSKAGD